MSDSVREANSESDWESDSIETDGTEEGDGDMHIDLSPGSHSA